MLHVVARAAGGDGRGGRLALGRNASTLWDEATIGAGQWTVTGTRTQTSVGTCLQIVLGTHTVFCIPSPGG